MNEPTGDLTMTAIMPLPKPKVCAIEDCDRPARARGWCVMHYKRWYRHGTPNAPARVLYDPVCSVKGCNRLHASLGFCSTCYEWFKRNGKAPSGPPWFR